MNGRHLTPVQGNNTQDARDAFKTGTDKGKYISGSRK